MHVLVSSSVTHQGGVKAVAFSPDGMTVITGSLDKTARLWEVATALPDDLERVAAWVQVLTGLELDEFGSARVPDSAAGLAPAPREAQTTGWPTGAGFEQKQCFATLWHLNQLFLQNRDDADLRARSDAAQARGAEEERPR
jgi:WD40 repeat protein